MQFIGDKNMRGSKALNDFYTKLSPLNEIERKLTTWLNVRMDEYHPQQLSGRLVHGGACCVFSRD